MTASTQWQLAREAAEQYERVLVPWILGPAAKVLVERADLKHGDTVLDVGCGTGAAARYAAERIGTAGRVIGVDVNAGMLAVARSLPPVAGASVEWREGSMYALPLDDESIDAVVCAQTLQFIADRPAALAEIHRVLGDGGRFGLSLWCPLHESPYFHALVEAMAAHIGEETATGLRSAFGFSDAAQIRAVLQQAGFKAIEMNVEPIELNLPEPEAFVPVHVRATPMAAGYEVATAQARTAVVQDVAQALAQYKTTDGVCVPFATHLVRATT